MRFMMLMILGDQSAEAGDLPDEKVVLPMMKYSEDMKRAGVLLALDSLKSSSKGARVGLSVGKRSVVHGPFPEAKEVIGGYWLIQVKSKEEAIEWACRCPAENTVIEVREVFEMTDFAASVRSLAEPFENMLKGR